MMKKFGLITVCCIPIKAAIAVGKFHNFAVFALRKFSCISNGRFFGAFCSLSFI